MLVNDNMIRELSVDEYFFLTENLEVINNATVHRGVAFLVKGKREKLNKIVKKVIENELKDEEKNIAFDFWTANISANEIAKKYGLSRSATYRSIEKIKNKLYSYLKYVLIYDSEALPYGKKELIEFVEGECTCGKIQ